MQAPRSPFTRPYLSPCLAPDSPGNLLPLITLPQTPRQTLKLSWLKPHPGSTPGLDSPALPCRSSSTSPRWPSACAAGNPHKPELAQPSPHCQALAQPWTLSTCLSVHRAGTSWALPPFSFLSPSSHLPTPQPLAPVGRPKCVGGSGSGVKMSRKSVQWGFVEVPWSLLPTAWDAAKRPFHAVHLSVWQAGWLGASAHLCAISVPMPGGGQQGPLPTWPLLCLCRSPKAHTLSMCFGPVVLSVCVCARVCVFLGAVACVSLCLCGCAMVSVSLHYPYVRLGVCVHPSVGAVPSPIPERGRTSLQLHQ